MRWSLVLLGTALAAGGVATAQAQPVEEGNDWRPAATQADMLCLRGRHVMVKGA